MKPNAKLINQFFNLVIIVVCIVFWTLVCFRISVLILAFLCLTTCLFVRSGQRKKLRNAFWLGAIILTILPMDLSFKTRPGPPKLLPVLYGAPMGEAVEEAKRGEIVLGGCVNSLFAPRWLLVW